MYKLKIKNIIFLMICGALLRNLPIFMGKYNVNVDITYIHQKILMDLLFIIIIHAHTYGVVRNIMNLYIKNYMKNRLYGNIL